jgi:hypothetical protein
MLKIMVAATLAAMCATTGTATAKTKQQPYLNENGDIIVNNGFFASRMQTIQFIPAGDQGKFCVVVIRQGEDGLEDGLRQKSSDSIVMQCWGRNGPLPVIPDE